MVMPDSQSKAYFEKYMAEDALKLHDEMPNTKPATVGNEWMGDFI